jgi:hypothetical protein
VEKLWKSCGKAAEKLWESFRKLMKHVESKATSMISRGKAAEKLWKSGRKAYQDPILIRRSQKHIRRNILK